MGALRPQGAGTDSIGERGVAVNYFGSSRKLMGNARAAMVGAIELYNKPYFEYRTECFAILVVNAWELLLKAVLSKSRVSIYRKKRRHQPYRTLGPQEALERIETRGVWPADFNPSGIQQNLSLLIEYRNNVVHFYGTEGADVLMHSLGQTAIQNFRDLMLAVFRQDLADDIGWELMPLGVRAPSDPLSFLQGDSEGGGSVALTQFLRATREALEEVEEANGDTHRVLMAYSVKLESTKKITSADLVVGVDPDAEGDPFLVRRRVDPNRSHPLREKDILKAIGDELHGVKFNSHTFRGLALREGWKDRPELCWQHEDTGLTTWSNEMVAMCRRFSANQLKAARDAYSAHLKAKRTR